MSNESIIYLVAACSGVFGLGAYVGLIVVPAWTAYSRVWERLAATFLTLYVLAAFLVLGVGRRRRRHLVLGPLHGLSWPRRRGLSTASPRIGACPPRPKDRRPGSTSLRWTRSPTPSSRAPACPRSSARAARALDASLVLTDRAGAVLAVAARSPADERALLDDAPGVEALELRVADAPVGTLRMRARSEPGPALVSSSRR